MPLSEAEQFNRVQQIRTSLRIMMADEWFMSQIEIGRQKGFPGTFHRGYYDDYSKAIEAAKGRITDAGRPPKAETYAPTQQILTLWGNPGIALNLLKQNPELRSKLTAEVGLKQWPFIEKITPKFLNQYLSAESIRHLFVCDDAAELVAAQFRFAAHEINRQLRTNLKSGGILGLILGLVRAKNKQDMVLAWDRFLKSQYQKDEPVVEPIENLGLPKNIVACLKAGGIYSSTSLKNTSDEELLKIDGIGPKTIAKIKELL